MLYFKRFDPREREEVFCIMRWENDDRIKACLRPAVENEPLFDLSEAEVLRGWENPSLICYLFGETPLENERPKRWLGFVDLQFAFPGMCGVREHAGWISICIGEPDGRGRGYGKTAMRFIEERAKEYGCKRLELGVFSFNAPAIALYEQMGYRRFAVNHAFTWKGGKPFDDIRMEKYI